MARLISIIYHMLILYLHGCWSSRPPLIAPNKLYGIKINCTRDVFNIKLDMDKSFKGVVFAKDFLEECRVKGESRNIPYFFLFRITYIEKSLV